LRSDFGCRESEKQEERERRAEEEPGEMPEQKFGLFVFHVQMVAKDPVALAQATEHREEKDEEGAD
jgi:hypothetical protein